MTDVADKPKAQDAEVATRMHRFREACVLQDIVGNPPTPDEIEIFERFEREGWSDERIIAFLTAQAKGEAEAGL
jgi:hypothetical protein